VKRFVGRLKKVPIETLRKIPFFPLSKFSSHKKEFFSGVPPHISKEGTQICKTLPEITWHLVNQGTLYMYDLIMRKWQNKVLGIGIHQRECNIIVMISSMDRIHVHVVQHIMHPTHIPFQTKS